MQRTDVGLLQQIKEAKSMVELGSLLHVGIDYKYASDKTRRKWQRAAEKRRQEIEHGNVEKV